MCYDHEVTVNNVDFVDVIGYMTTNKLKKGIADNI